MKISTKGRYALRIIIDLARHDKDGLTTLQTLADRQDISKKYLEQIVPLLNKGGILITERGFGGGYRLAKSPDDITAADILKLTEGSLEPVACLESGDPESFCNRTADCPTLPVWKGLSKVINEYLEGITITDIINQAEGAGDDYVI
ncbi:MAG: Rrf2 family transcriptional regulator [Clostridiales bacterium]|nr:Rrf2 family transcriptional regulator [Clostridiales bacterium]